jgi:hypothetical protein
MDVTSRGYLRRLERAQLLRMTTLFERSVWIVQRYADLLQRRLEPNVDRRVAQPMSA